MRLLRIAFVAACALLGALAPVAVPAGTVANMPLEGRALANVVPTHLMDRNLHDFAAVRPTHRAEPDGDLAFDVEMPSMPPLDDEGAAALGGLALQVR